MERTVLSRSDVRVACGAWKFNENITPEQLAELAREWASNSSRYVSLYVRSTGKDKCGIDFIYVLSAGADDENPEEYEKFFYRMSDQLKRRFGNDLIGWDISSFAQIIV